jgi:hypothetical protein
MIQEVFARDLRCVTQYCTRVDVKAVEGDVFVKGVTLRV